MQRNHIKLLPIVIFLLYGVFYYFDNRQTVPITGRSQIVEISRDQEISLGIQSYDQVLHQEHVMRSGPEVDLVRSVGQRIAKAADIADFQWEFNVIESKEANAFCLPGGKVVVNTGIIPVAQSADGLAVVLGHEIAHAVARHGAERMAQQQLLEFGKMAVGMAVQDMDNSAQRTVLGVFGVGSQFGLMLPFSRTHESEADHIGLILLARACFDPAEAPKFWERMMKMSSGGSPPGFLSTHPTNEKRVSQLEGWMAEAMSERAKYCSTSERSAS